MWLETSGIGGSGWQWIQALASIVPSSFANRRVTRRVTGRGISEGEMLGIAVAVARPAATSGGAPVFERTTVGRAAAGTGLGLTEGPGFGAGPAGGPGFGAAGFGATGFGALAGAGLAAGGAASAAGAPVRSVLQTRQRVSPARLRNLHLGQATVLSPANDLSFRRSRTQINVVERGGPAQRKD
jgi:hypothetical protein